MEFELIAGYKPNQPPIIDEQIVDQIAYRSQLYYLKITEEMFTDPDGDLLTFLVSQADGTFIPDWLQYEDVSQTISGIANDNSTDIEFQIVADDGRGGSVTMFFTVQVLNLTDKNFSFVGLAIVSALLLLFIVGVSVAVWLKSRKKKKKAG